MPHDASPASEPVLTLAGKSLDVPLCPPWLMGIVNVTPDSFSDGGQCLDVSSAVARALEQIHDGARIVDIGAESTRPGSLPVPAKEQIRRALPVIEELRARDAQTPISIDTCLAEVAHAALQSGATLVNDTSALRDDDRMVRVLASHGAPVVLMHRKGAPHHMQDGGGPEYADVISEIMAFLSERLSFAIRSAIPASHIILDPGIGFGKKTLHNLLLLQQLSRFRELGRPILVGASRKRFIGEVLELPESVSRDTPSVACALIAAMNGASIIRVHNVKASVEALRMWDAVRSADPA